MRSLREYVAMGEKFTGRVKHWGAAKGFGFLVIEGDPESKKVFVHYEDIVGKPGEFRDLSLGCKVMFTVEQTPKGPRARRVERVPEDATAPGACG